MITLVEMMLQQAGSMTSLIHSPHTVNSGTGGACTEMSGRYLHDSAARGFISPTYMPIRDSFDRGNKKGSWVRLSLPYLPHSTAERDRSSLVVRHSHNHSFEKVFSSVP